MFFLIRLFYNKNGDIMNYLQVIEILNKMDKNILKSKLTTYTLVSNNYKNDI